MAAVQHYVPQCLLKNFCAGPKPKLWVYDKSADRSFETTVQNIAGERQFYEVDIGDKRLSLEDGLARLESRTAAIVERTIKARNLKDLTEEEDRAALAIFVAIQMARVPHQREHLLAIDQGIQRWLREHGIDPTQVENYRPLTEDDAKAVALMALLRPNEQATHIANKSWLLFETSGAKPFYISDNPVTMQNLVEPKGPLRGNLGLAVPGIEIYLPISSTLTLGFYCRSHEEVISSYVERYRSLMIRNPTAQLPDFRPVFEWFRAFRDGITLASAPENVENHNSLQVRNAERFIFSSSPDFSLVQEMLADEPRFRIGPRPIVA